MTVHCAAVGFRFGNAGDNQTVGGTSPEIRTEQRAGHVNRRSKQFVDTPSRR